MTTNPILAEFQGKPAFLAEGKSAQFEACIEKVAEKIDFFEAAAAEYVAGEESFWDYEDDSFMAMVRPYRVQGGILTIPVRGVLKNNFPFQFRGYATGYEYILEAMRRGVDDPSVKGIALQVDSPGGAVPGLFDLADRLYALRGRKPIKAFAADMAASAAYCVASCADDITVTRTGEVGSIGVIGVHAEMSKRLAAEGITVTFIRSKPFKGEGGSKEPLRPETEARMQAQVDELHNQFVAIVARNRSMSAADVDATDALTFMGESGVQKGLADKVAPFDDAITAFAASFKTWTGVGHMAEQNQADVIAMADHNAKLTAAKAEGVTEGKAAGAAEERARITAILASDAGKTRPAAAMMMVNLGVTAEQASVELAKLPEESAAAPAATAPAPAAPVGAGAPAGMLEAAMGGSQNPNLGAQTNGGEVNADDALMANIAAAGLAGFKALKQ